MRISVSLDERRTEICRICQHQAYDIQVDHESDHGGRLHDAHDSTRTSGCQHCKLPSAPVQALPSLFFPFLVEPQRVIKTLPWPFRGYLVSVRRLLVPLFGHGSGVGGPVPVQG